MGRRFCIDSRQPSGKLLRMSSQLQSNRGRAGGDAMDDGYGYLPLIALEAAPPT